MSRAARRLRSAPQRFDRKREQSTTVFASEPRACPLRRGKHGATRRSATHTREIRRGTYVAPLRTLAPETFGVRHGLQAGDEVSLPLQQRRTDLLRRHRDDEDSDPRSAGAWLSHRPAPALRNFPSIPRLACRTAAGNRATRRRSAPPRPRLVREHDLPGASDVMANGRLAASIGMAALAALLVGGCASGHRARVAANGPAGDTDLISSRDRAALETLGAERRDPPVADNGYRIGPDDLLQIRIPDLFDVGGAPRPTPAPGFSPVSGAPTFDQGVRVSASGHVRLPMLGLLPAQGRTPTELEGEIARRLVAAGILRHPQVSVLVAEYRSRVVAVVGSVERPGLYPLTRAGATVAELIWAAGGPNKDAGRVVEFVPMRGDEPARAGDGIERGALAEHAPKGQPVRLALQVLLHPPRP